MRIVIAIISVLVITASVLLGIHFFSGNDLEDAIRDFEDGDYTEAIEKFNALIPLSDYEGSEKIYYYRARALNGLAQELEEDLSDELSRASLGRETTAEYKEAQADIIRTLEKMNSRTGGDLELIIGRPRSSIVSKGKFYDEFTVKYRGSNLIEDLDFEQLRKIEKTQEENKSLRSVIQFYRKYPNTGYIAQLVKMMFTQLQKGTAKMSEQGKTMFDIIISYGRRYPTSPEINLIYTCTGDGVNLRNSPGTKADRVGTVPQNAVLIQLEKSMDTSQVGDVRDYWYRVADLTGQRGWIFGKFLRPFDIKDYKISEAGEKWTLDEEFEAWTDSNTPENWRHVDETAKGCLSFINQGSMRLAIINAGKEQSCGLFTRYNASRAFSVLCRARYTGGDALTLFAYSFGDGSVYQVIIKNEEIDVCGRTIPIHTGDWHDYRLTSGDGKFATLSVDGEVLSGRITPARKKQFELRGIYAFCSKKGEASKGEIQYLKAR